MVDFGKHLKNWAGPTVKFRAPLTCEVNRRVCTVHTFVLNEQTWLNTFLAVTITFFYDI